MDEISFFFLYYNPIDSGAEKPTTGKKATKILIILMGYMLSLELSIPNHRSQKVGLLTPPPKKPPPCQSPLNSYWLVTISYVFYLTTFFQSTSNGFRKMF